ncbi:MAG: hypothetical protein ACRCWO_04195 [Bosea sp. (in: a-proteobacteria)]
MSGPVWMMAGRSCVWVPFELLVIELLVIELLAVTLLAMDTLPCISSRAFAACFPQQARNGLISIFNRLKL